MARLGLAVMAIAVGLSPAILSAKTLDIVLSATPACSGRLNNVDLPPSALAEALLALPQQPKVIRIVANGDVPYRCVGQMIYVLQRGGVGKIKFKVR